MAAIASERQEIDLLAIGKAAMFSKIWKLRSPHSIFRIPIRYYYPLMNNQNQLFKQILNFFSWSRRELDCSSFGNPRWVNAAESQMLEINGKASSMHNNESISYSYIYTRMRNLYKFTRYFKEGELTHTSLRFENLLHLEKFIYIFFKLLIYHLIFTKK